MLLFTSACAIIAAAEDSESYDTEDIDGKKIVSQTSVCAFLPSFVVCLFVSPLDNYRKYISDDGRRLFISVMIPLRVTV